MSIEHWIMVYLFLNGALCYISGSDAWEDPFSIENIGMAMLCAAFALPISIAMLSYQGALSIVGWLDSLIQFRTYWHYVFDRKRLIVDDHDILLVMYRMGHKYRGSTSIQSWLWRNAERLIHKENNYMPPTNTTEG